MVETTKKEANSISCVPAGSPMASKKIDSLERLYNRHLLKTSRKNNDAMVIADLNDQIR